MNEDSIYRASTIKLLFSGVEMYTKSLSTKSISALLLHKLVDYCGSEPVQRENQAAIFGVLLFLTGKISERIQTLNSCIITGIILAEGDYDEVECKSKVEVIKGRVVELEHLILRIVSFNTEFQLPNQILRRLDRDHKISKKVIRLAEDNLLRAAVLKEFASLPASVLAAAALEHALQLRGEKSMRGLLASSLDIQEEEIYRGIEVCRGADK